MDLSTIEQHAMRLEELPDGLNSIEQYTFLALRSLYRDFRAGHIQKAAAKREKDEINRAYNEGAMLYRIFEQDTAKHNRLSHVMIEINKSGCPLCKKAVAIFDGRDRT